jgi:hypothetical protein
MAVLVLVDNTIDGSIDDGRDDDGDYANALDDAMDDAEYEGDDDWAYEGDTVGYYNYEEYDNGYEYGYDDIEYEHSDYIGGWNDVIDDDKTFAAKWGWQKWRALEGAEELQDVVFFDEEYYGDAGHGDRFV